VAERREQQPAGLHLPEGRGQHAAVSCLTYAFYSDYIVSVSSV
jgi:hypothetical protein